jgi:hypothetical protein
MAIAAARETAALDRGEFREAAWFLQNRTYVDDATAGADSKERLIALFKEMEAVAKGGGFEFKETLMSGDKESEDGEPRKVLGVDLGDRGRPTEGGCQAQPRGQESGPAP